MLHNCLRTCVVNVSNNLTARRQCFSVLLSSSLATQTYSTVQPLKQHLLHLQHHSQHQYLHRHLIRADQRRCSAFSSGGSENDTSGSIPKSLPLKAAGAAALNFISAQFLPLALLSVLLLGAVQPAWGAAAAQTHLQKYATIAMFVLSGVSLKRGEAMIALQSTGSFAYGLSSILLITPLAALVALALPLEPIGLRVGLAVFCCVPTSLSSNIAMTQTLGGNTAMSLLLTITSNVLAVFTIPLLLPVLLDSAIGSASSGMHIQALPLLQNLVLTLLLPAMAGAAAREWVPGVANLVDSNRKVVSLISSAILCMVPWMQVSKALMKPLGLDMSGLVSAAAAGCVLHVGFLALNVGAAAALQLGGTNPIEAQRTRQAVILATSQKTLPVAITLLGQLSGVLGDSVGVAAVAIVFTHLGQIVIDSWLVSHWLQKQWQKPKLGFV